MRLFGRFLRWWRGSATAAEREALKRERYRHEAEHAEEKLRLMNPNIKN